MLCTLIANRPCASNIDARTLIRPTENFTVSREIAIETVSAGGVAAEWAAMKQADGDRVMLYLENGVSVIGLIDSYFHVADLCHETVNGVEETVGQLPSEPSTHTYHEPAVAGVGTY
jgi:hypothetical protein